MEQTKLIFLHGLGQTATDWQPVLSELQTTNTLSLSLFEDFSAQDRLDLERLHAALTRKMAVIDEPYILCGLSLGAVLALKQAIAAAPLL